MCLGRDFDTQKSIACTSDDGYVDQDAVPPTVTPPDKSPAVPASPSPSPQRYIPPALRRIQGGHLNKDENADKSPTVRVSCPPPRPVSRMSALLKTPGRHLNNDENAAVPLQDNMRNPNRENRPRLWPLFLHRAIALPPGSRRLLTSVSRGLQKGNNPISHRPSGGTYFMRNGSGDKIAGIFKPANEEAKAVNSARGLKKGTKVGEAALVEVAISLLDHPRPAPSVDGDMKKGTFSARGVSIGILYQGALLDFVVHGDMNNGFSTRGAPLKIGILYRGAYRQVVHRFLKDGYGGPVTIEFLYEGALWKKVVEGDMNKGFSTRGVPLTIGILYEAAFCEVVVDGDTKNGFSGVPLTIMVACAFNHPQGFHGDQNSCIKVGSLQQFIQNSRNCALVEDPWNFPVEEVHKIAVLDLRVGNADRHAGNILWKREGDGSYKLIPIDHGYCLPQSFEAFKFEWLDWPQARQPFSKETLGYIKSLDAEKDIKFLKLIGFNSELSLRTFRILTSLLKDGAERRLSPYEIGRILCRENYEKSVIEKVIAEAHDMLFPGATEARFLQIVSDFLRVELNRVKMRPLQLRDFVTEMES